MQNYTTWDLGRFQDLDRQLSQVATTRNQRSRLRYQETQVLGVSWPDYGAANAGERPLSWALMEGDPVTGTGGRTLKGCGFPLLEDPVLRGLSTKPRQGLQRAARPRYQNCVKTKWNWLRSWFPVEFLSSFLRDSFSPEWIRSQNFQWGGSHKNPTWKGQSPVGTGSNHIILNRAAETGCVWVLNARITVGQ